MREKRNYDSYPRNYDTHLFCIFLYVEEKFLQFRTIPSVNCYNLNDETKEILNMSTSTFIYLDLLENTRKQRYGCREKRISWNQNSLRIVLENIPDGFKMESTPIDGFSI